MSRAHVLLSASYKLRIEHTSFTYNGYLDISIHEHILAHNALERWMRSNTFLMWVAMNTGSMLSEAARTIYRGFFNGFFFAENSASLSPFTAEIMFKFSNRMFYLTFNFSYRILNKYCYSCKERNMEQFTVQKQTNAIFSTQTTPFNSRIGHSFDVFIILSASIHRQQ